VRRHEGPESVTLEEYRARHACYRSDPLLQAAHAACAWILTWDDHEVENDYAGDRSENDDEPAWFLARRAAAYEDDHRSRGVTPYGRLQMTMRPLVGHSSDLRLHPNGNQ
jgi:alkaline phosphatase D